jgi:hypothetical protein
MVWCLGIVEIVRRTTRELFHHESMIGNFFGKYLVMTWETDAFARKYPASTARKHGWPGDCPAIEVPSRPALTGLNILPNG